MSMRREHTQTNILDLHSLLVKPIQRAMRYPLMLHELLRNTEQTSQTNRNEWRELDEAVRAMQAIAASLNEIKRRRDMSNSHLSTSFNRARS